MLGCWCSPPLLVDKLTGLKLQVDVLRNGQNLYYAGSLVFYDGWPDCILSGSIAICPCYFVYLYRHRNRMKHNRQSIRLKGYNYGQSGLYFITICTHNRDHLFGKIINKEMVLNEAGKVATKCWREIPVHFPIAVLHEYVIMPDHIHGIIEIISPKNELLPPVGIQNLESLPAVTENTFQHIIPQSIGSIIRGFKIGVTKWFRYANGFSPEMQVWQRNYHDHIIRNEIEYTRIALYILNNPANWDKNKTGK